MCVEKSLLQEIGGFPVGVTSGEDLLTWARIAVKTDWAYSRKATAVFNLGDISLAKPRRLHDDYDFVGEELTKLLVANNNVVGLRQYLSLWYKMRAMTFLQGFNKQAAIRLSCLSIKYNPWNIKVYAYLIVALLPSGLIKKIIERFTRL